MKREILTPGLPRRLDRSAALRYLGAGGGAARSGRAPGEALAPLLDYAEAVLRREACPRALWARLPRTQLAPLLRGDDIERHLAGCEECAVFACTLGARVDAAQRAANVSDMARGMALDALSSALAEQIADAAEAAFRTAVEGEGLFLTGRFSPGYGDYPIEVQNELIRVIDAPRAIGLCATPSHLLAPRKSVTAVLGVADHPVTGRRAGCAHCALRETCAYRKEGKTCGTDL